MDGDSEEGMSEIRLLGKPTHYQAEGQWHTLCGRCHVEYKTDMKHKADCLVCKKAIRAFYKKQERKSE